MRPGNLHFLVWKSHHIRTPSLGHSGQSARTFSRLAPVILLDHSAYHERTRKTFHVAPPRAMRQTSHVARHPDMTVSTRGGDKQREDHGVDKRPLVRLFFIHRLLESRVWRSHPTRLGQSVGGCRPDLYRAGNRKADRRSTKDCSFRKYPIIFRELGLGGRHLYGHRHVGVEVS